MSLPDLLRIEVSRVDIANGIREDARQCPIARAVRQLLPSAVDVEVDSALCISTADGYFVYTLPDDAFNFIYEFDNDRDPSPFTFEAPLDGDI